MRNSRDGWKKIARKVGAVLLLIIISFPNTARILAEGILQVQLKQGISLVVQEPVTEDMFSYALDNMEIAKYENITISPSCFYESGEQEVCVEYRKGEAIYYSKVKVFVESLRREALETDLQCFPVVEGQEIGKEHIPVVYVLWNNGKREQIKDYTYKVNWEEKNIIISYEQLECCISLEVLPNEIKDMQVTCKHQSVAGDYRFSCEDFSVHVIYTNGKTEEVKDFVILPYTLKEGMSTCISLEYKGKIEECKVVVNKGKEEIHNKEEETGEHKEAEESTEKEQEKGDISEDKFREDAGKEQDKEDAKNEESRDEQNKEDTKNEENTNEQTREEVKVEDGQTKEEAKSEGFAILSTNLLFENTESEGTTEYYGETVFLKSVSEKPCYYQLVKKGENLSNQWLPLPEYWELTGSVTACRMYIRYEDEIGNEKLLQSKCFLVDKKKPETNVKNKVYKKNVKITAGDKESGIASIKLSGTVKKKISVPYVLKKEGDYTLTITDAVGNVKNVKFSIKKPAKKVTVSYENTGKWNRIKFRAKVIGTGRSVVWSVDNKTIGIMKKNGIFEAKRTGTCYVTAKIDGIRVKKKILVFKNEKLIFIF